MHHPGALIAGGGPAGAAAAIMLARGGARPLILERTREAHDVVCGGFLGWDGLAALDALGVSGADLSAHPIGRVRLVAGTRSFEAALPFAAAGLSRRTLDTALLAAAARGGAVIERGVVMRAIDDGAVRLGDGARVRGNGLFLATGKHELRGGRRPAPANPSVGFRLRLERSPVLARALDHHIELHLFAGGYAGLLVQEDGSVNLCLSVDEARLKVCGGSVMGVIEHVGGPRLGERIASAAGQGAWSTIAGVPYGWHTADTAPGLFRLGDQAAVIASLAGDGVAIALASGSMAASAWLRDGAGGAEAYQQRFAARARRPLAVASGLRAIAERPDLGAPMLGLLAIVPGLARIAARLTRIGH
jgi:flavin-dependent dehydrogenase